MLEIMNDKKEDDNKEQDTFYSRLKLASTKIRMEEFLKKDVYDQVQELEYLLGYNEDRLIELGFERKRIEKRMEHSTSPSIRDRYGIDVRTEHDHEGIINKEREDELSKRLLKLERDDPIKFSKVINEIDIEIDKRIKAVQILEEEIQMREEMIFELGIDRDEKPKFTPSILYDKESPDFESVKKKSKKISLDKKKISTFTLKICILGKEGVGISTWLQSFPNMFDNLKEMENYMLEGVGFRVKSLRLNDITFKLQIWFLNTHRITDKNHYHYSPHTFKHLIRGSNGAFLVYDITNYESLSPLPDWIQSIKETCGDIPILLIGNKCDLENLRELSKDQGIALAKKFNLSKSYEISVKTGEHLEILYQKISELYHQKFWEGEYNKN